MLLTERQTSQLSGTEQSQTLTIQPCSTCHSTVVMTSVPGYTPCPRGGCVSSGIPPVLPPIATYPPTKPGEGPPASSMPGRVTAPVEQPGTMPTTGSAPGTSKGGGSPVPSQGSPAHGDKPADSSKTRPSAAVGGTTRTHSEISGTTTSSTAPSPSGPPRPYVTGAGSRASSFGGALVLVAVACLFVAF